MAAARREQRMLATASLVVLAVVAIAYILWFTRSVMIPFVLAVFVVVLVAPLGDFLERRARFPRWLSILVLLLLVLVITAAFLLLLVYMGGEIGTTAASYSNNIRDLVTDLINAEQDGNPENVIAIEGATEDQSVLDRFADWIKLHFAEIIDWAKRQVVPMLEKLAANLPNILVKIFGSIISILTTFFLMIIFVMFLLAARDPKQVVKGFYADIEIKIRSYLAIKTILSAVTALLVGLILWLFGLQLVVVFAVLTFLLNFIPSLGSIIATLLPLPIAWAQFVADANNPSWWPVIGVLVLPGAVQTTIGNVIEPRIMGKGLDLHPIVVLFALAFWTILWGPVGAILAVPITAVVRIVILQFTSLEPVSNLMSGTLPELGRTGKKQG